MIQVSIRNNVSRKTVIAEPTDTLRGTLDNNGFTTSGVSYNLNGTFINDSVLDKSFAELGIAGGTAFLMAVKNAENA